jgi:hypothetical protein
MGEELAKGFALSTAWVDGDMASWTELAAMWIDENALDLVGELSHIIGQMASALALIEGPDCSPEIILQQLSLEAERPPSGD